MSEIILPADVEDAPLRDEEAHLREATRATMLAETLQLGRYSAVTQGAAVLVLAGIFWNIASQAYLCGLAAVVTALCAGPSSPWTATPAVSASVRSPAKPSSSSMSWRSAGGSPGRACRRSCCRRSTTPTGSWLGPSAPP